MIKNKEEVVQNLFSLLQGYANIIVQLMKGYKFHVRDMYDLLVLKEVFGDEIYRFIFEGIEKNTTLVDLGAYIADTEVYARQFQNVINIIALEPMPENYNLAKQNIKLNKIKNVTLLPLAISGSRGTAKLFIHPNKGQSGFFQRSRIKQMIKVKTITLADIVKNIKTSNIILKCDCEGAEYPMFMETSVAILSKFKKIAFEYHDDKKLKKIISKLKKSGFRINTVKHLVEPNLGIAYATRN